MIMPKSVVLDHYMDLSIYRRMLTVSTTTGYVRGKRDLPHYIELHSMPGFNPRWTTLKPAEALSSSLRDERCFEKIRE